MDTLCSKIFLTKQHVTFLVFVTTVAGIAARRRTSSQGPVGARHGAMSKTTHPLCPNPIALIPRRKTMLLENVDFISSCPTSRKLSHDD